MICLKSRKRSGTPRNLRVAQHVRGTTRKFRSAPLAALFIAPTLAALVKLILGQFLSVPDVRCRCNGYRQATCKFTADT